MWIKVEDPKIRILETLTLSNYNKTTGEVTVTAATGGYFPNGGPGWNVAQYDILEFAPLDPRTLLPMEKCSIFIRSTGTIGAGVTATFKIEWVSAADIKTEYKDGLDDYYRTAIPELEDLVAGTVGTDYQVYKLAQGAYHTHHAIQTSYILSIVDGRKEALLNDEDMFLATCCSYAPGATDKTTYNIGEGESAAAPSTANYLSTNISTIYGAAKRAATDTGGNLGPFFNRTDELCEFLLYGGPPPAKANIATERQKIPRRPTGGYYDDGDMGDPRNPRDPVWDGKGPRDPRIRPPRKPVRGTKGETGDKGDKFVTKYKPRSENTR